MSARTDEAWNNLNADLCKKQDLEERIMSSKSDDWWIKRSFGERIKITGNLIFAPSPQHFLKEIDRQNKLIDQGLQ